MDPAVSQQRRIVDSDFAKRLDKAISGRDGAPFGHGRQKWLRDQLEFKFNEKLSAEALRKWFAGEARPRPKMMAKIAQVLEVDEAWLSLGLTPSQTPVEKKKHNALTTGAINLAAGLFQLAGGNIAFAEGADRGYDFQAIIGGKSYAVQVKYVTEGAKAKFAIDQKHLDDQLVILVAGDGLQLKNYEVYRVPKNFVDKHGKRKGGFIEFDLQRDGTLRSGDDFLPLIEDLGNLSSEMSRETA